MDKSKELKMMDEGLHRNIERIVHGAEVRAVAECLRAGREARVGDVFEYTVDLPVELSRRYCTRRNRYQFAVEKWHLEAAADAIAQGPSR